MNDKLIEYYKETYGGTDEDAKRFLSFCTIIPNVTAVITEDGDAEYLYEVDGKLQPIEF